MIQLLQAFHVKNDKHVASSAAESPPPITAKGLFLYYRGH